MSGWEPAPGHVLGVEQVAAFIPVPQAVLDDAQDWWSIIEASHRRQLILDDERELYQAAYGELDDDQWAILRRVFLEEQAARERAHRRLDRRAGRAWAELRRRLAHARLALQGHWPEEDD